MNKTSKLGSFVLGFVLLFLGLAACDSPEIPEFTPASAADSVVITAFYDKLEALHDVATNDTAAIDSACKLSVSNHENICVVPLLSLGARLANQTSEAAKYDPFDGLNLHCPVEVEAWKKYTKEFADEVKKVEAAKYLVTLETTHHELPIQNENGFQTGIVSGYIGVYNYDDLALRCKIPVYAENSGYVFVDENEHAKIVEVELKVDLEMRVGKAVEDSLTSIFGVKIDLY